MSKDASIRSVLEGVDKISWEDQTVVENSPFAAALRAVMTFLGEDFTYDYILSASGDAFRFLWDDNRWKTGVTIVPTDQLAKSYSRAIDAVAYEYQFLGNKDCEKVEGTLAFGNQVDSSVIKHLIIESIKEEQSPVLANGVVGPPETCIITGYDEEGDVLIGWSFFQNDPNFNQELEFEPSGYFRKRNWEIETAAILLIKGKLENPIPKDEIYKKTLANAIKLIKTEEIGAFKSGLSAYDQWISDLENDVFFEKMTAEELQQAVACHQGAIGETAEDKWYASNFLAKMAQQKPFVAKELLMAAAAFADIHELMWKSWQVVGGYWREPKEESEKLVKRGVRQQAASILREMVKNVREAVASFEQALERWDTGHRTYMT